MVTQAPSEAPQPLVDLAANSQGIPTKPKPSLSLRKYDERLSLPYPLRQTISVLAGIGIGMVMGVSLGAKNAGLRFRAENAHRLPTTHKGWYLYHKSKNYYAMWGGLKEGGRAATKLGFWAGAFVAIEQSVDNLRRGTKDALSTVVASLTCAGAFAAWNRFPLPTAARTVKTGLAFGLLYGVTQDLMRFARGNSVSYISFFTRGFGSTEEKDSSPVG